MIKAKHHIFIYPLFQFLTVYLIKRNFNSVTISGNFNDNGKSVLIIANHVSWWDGFWLMWLNLKVIKRKFHFMMLEEQLRKHWYFQYTGGFSVKKNSRSIIESISYTIDLLNKPDNLVIMFPQGKITSIYNNSFIFERGIKRILQNINPLTQVIFVANLIDYFSDKKPNLYIYFKNYLIQDLNQIKIQSAYENFYNEILSNHKLKIS